MHLDPSLGELRANLFQGRPGTQISQINRPSPVAHKGPRIRPASSRYGPGHCKTATPDLADLLNSDDEDGPDEAELVDHFEEVEERYRWNQGVAQKKALANTAQPTQPDLSNQATVDNCEWPDSQSTSSDNNNAFNPPPTPSPSYINYNKLSFTNNPNSLGISKSSATSYKERIIIKTLRYHTAITYSDIAKAMNLTYRQVQYTAYGPTRPRYSEAYSRVPVVPKEVKQIINNLINTPHHSWVPAGDT
ncbi:uncharacterized protein B0H64DRAFT_428956 [Chaetomium fimeti]|uniref:Uncharacterized protein n=1 Tax=Chaetomium fimeti TaxID=1854472 RepID=A0AAE0HRE3_9PEZI|nr:hypothetical protein B0H64DRAFT_428956 [Chaetomium fimeti]